MKFGICLPIRLEASAQENVSIALKAEGLGFDSVWVSDHIVMPEKHRGMFSEIFYEPFTLLTYISAVTSTISLGTSVIILPYRSPLVTAKQIATLDTLSGGRVMFGVGPGWMKEEFDSLGVPIQGRGKRTDEYISAIRELWVSESPEFSGEFCTFRGIKFEPKPLQDPHPPVLIAGASKFALKRAAFLGDGWQPTWVTLEDVETGIASIKKLAKEANRDLDGFIYSVRNRVKIFETNDQKESYISKQPTSAPFSLQGTLDEIKTYVAGYAKAGVSHMVFDPAADSLDEIYSTMDILAGEIISYFK